MQREQVLADEAIARSFCSPHKSQEQESADAAANFDQWQARLKRRTTRLVYGFAIVALAVAWWIMAAGYIARHSVPPPETGGDARPSIAAPTPVSPFPANTAKPRGVAAPGA